MRPTSALVLALAALAACATPAPTASAPDALTFFPRYRPLNAYPAALVTGHLRLHDGCLWLSADDAEYLVLWPPDSEVLAAAGAVYVSIDRASIPPGSRVRVGGGEYKDEHTAWIEDELIGQLIPHSCRRGRYWLATEISPV